MLIMWSKGCAEVSEQFSGGFADITRVDASVGNLGEPSHRLTVNHVLQLFPEKSHLSFNLVIMLPADLTLHWGKSFQNKVRSCLAGRAAVVVVLY